MITRADRITPLTNQDRIYSDFLTDLNPHPVSKDIVKLVNERAVIKSMKNLLLTNRGERLYQPTIGGDINKLLFENASSGVAQILSKSIYDTLRKFETRANTVKVHVDFDDGQNAYLVNVVFMLINKQEPISFTVTLERAR